MKFILGVLCTLISAAAYGQGSLPRNPSVIQMTISRDPITPLETATKQYVDGGISGKLSLTGGSLTGPLLLAADPSNALGAATKQYVDVGDAGKLLLTGGTLTGLLSLANSSATPDPTYASGGLSNQIVLASGGNMIEYCPILSCVTTPTSGHQRASAVFWATTQFDGIAEEQTVAVETIVGTGFSKTWATSMAFSVGDNVSFGAANTVYRATTGGVSAPSGTGPTGTGSGITDGTVVWAWINAAAINAKVGLYGEESVVAGAGHSWVQANNVTLQTGSTPTFNINTELDYTNNAADCNLGIANCNSLEMNMGGTNKSTTGIHLGSTNAGPGYGAIWGLRLNGTFLASNADIEIDSSAPIGIGFGSSGLGGAHSNSAIEDASVGGVNSLHVIGTKTGSDINISTASPTAFQNSGTHSLGTMFDNSSSPVVFNISGTHSAETFNDTSTSPAGFNLSGTYSVAAINVSGAGTAMIVGNNQKVCWGTGAGFCAELDSVSGKFVLFDISTRIMSIDASGNAIFKGTVTQSGTP